MMPAHHPPDRRGPGGPNKISCCRQQPLVEMAKKRKNQRIGQSHRRMLKMLAKVQLGCDVNVLLFHGFSFEIMGDLVGSGLATVQLESTKKSSGQTVTVARLRITDEGRRALAEGGS